ncbi:MAG: glycine--tRNA ligase subunit beta [Syntrophomonadaceae bacterium]|nr:glycine--tRNA ligase subunit beta [Syntrophomonadaceae bacterium]MDD3889088.1 glycine--tRNA ligase subunit beta [Syntrophomonadaceae bacterium]MDD4549498.1 glycine--tRNA ligase subunit beta [Syntrophomonadaceae bacterium]
MSRNMLLEIGVEELPSSYVPRAITDIKNMAGNKLAETRLQYSDLKVYGTPRRLTLVITNLAERQKDAVIANKGPKKAIAFDSEGNPGKPGLGFARGQGVDFTDLEIREIDGIEYVFAIKKEEGIATSDLLPGILVDIINSLGFPKSMRWGYYHTRFARPVRWLLALYGDEKIEISLENVKSSVYTYGHRFLSSGPLEIKDSQSYFQVLKDNYVILDQDERKQMLREQIDKVATLAGGKPAEDEALLDEITYLVEYPTAFYGEFSPSYLDVPPEVLTTTMIEHQRYFPVFDDQNKLLPGFIGVRNGTDFSLNVVKAGNERVLKARLEDALFFWNEDTKKPLDTMVDKLKNVLFHERLGNLMEKVERLHETALFIGKESGLSDKVKLSRATYLCKADLVSNMVYEFTELQGVIGRYYAIESGEEKEVCEAIYEHYLPRFAGDNLPATETGIVLSLADKIDNLVGCFAIGIRPTGSQDPYALRRQAMGIVNIILDTSLQIDLKSVLTVAYDNFAGIKLDNERDSTVIEVLDFIFQRMRGILLEKGISYDVFDAVLAKPSGDLQDIVSRIDAVRQFKADDKFEDFMVVFNRANNLSKKWLKDDINPKLLSDASEIKLYESFIEIKGEVKRAVELREYLQALDIIAGLRTQLDNFFSAVMVMVDDEALKATRLGLLKSITSLSNPIADFSKLVQ